MEEAIQEAKGKKGGQGKSGHADGKAGVRSAERTDQAEAKPGDVAGKVSRRGDLSKMPTAMYVGKDQVGKELVGFKQRAQAMGAQLVNAMRAGNYETDLKWADDGTLVVFGRHSKVDKEQPGTMKRVKDQAEIAASRIQLLGFKVELVLKADYVKLTALHNAEGDADMPQSVPDPEKATHGTHVNADGTISKANSQRDVPIREAIGKGATALSAEAMKYNEEAEAYRAKQHELNAEKRGDGQPSEPVNEGKQPDTGDAGNNGT